MSRYLNVALEAKIDGKYKLIPLTSEDKIEWYQGSIRDYLEEYSDTKYSFTEGSEEFLKIKEQFEEWCRFYSLSLPELSLLAEKEKSKWLLEYTEALTKNYFCNKLAEVSGKKVEDENNSCLLEYLRDEGLYEWECLSNLAFHLEQCLRNNDIYNTDNARIIYWIS